VPAAQLAPRRHDWTRPPFEIVAWHLGLQRCEPRRRGLRRARYRRRCSLLELLVPLVLCLDSWCYRQHSIDWMVSDCGGGGAVSPSILVESHGLLRRRVSSLSRSLAIASIARWAHLRQRTARELV